MGEMSWALGYRHGIVDKCGFRDRGRWQMFRVRLWKAAINIIENISVCTSMLWPIKLLNYLFLGLFVCLFFDSLCKMYTAWSTWWVTLIVMYSKIFNCRSYILKKKLSIDLQQKLYNSKHSSCPSSYRPKKAVIYTYSCYLYYWFPWEANVYNNARRENPYEVNNTNRL